MVRCQKLAASCQVHYSAAVAGWLQAGQPSPLPLRPARTCSCAAEVRGTCT